MKRVGDDQVDKGFDSRVEPFSDGDKKPPSEDSPQEADTSHKDGSVDNLKAGDWNEKNRDPATDGIEL